MGSKPKKPKVVAAPDPQVEAQKAADLATQKANTETAARKKRKQESSLLSSAGPRGIARGGATESVLEQGKSTLGS
jgi:hypothetical protein